MHTYGVALAAIRGHARARLEGVAASVELQNVTKTFGPVRALVGVSASFESSRVSVVRGANGSGKSTLLSIVGTLARATSGAVKHPGIGKRALEVRRQMGWLGHESLCYPELTGRENIELAARLYGCDAAAAFERARERFDLGAFAERPLRTYSRGQRQRVALARALVHAPTLLLLDEPTTGLDAATTARLTSVIREEAERGAVVLVVTHDAGFAEAVRDDELELERGRVLRRDSSARGASEGRG
jgi:heme exporter protein A